MEQEIKTIESFFLLIDKPVDWTSHDIVAYLRSVLKIKKIGHAGTLDPFATGLLIVAVGRQATKRIDQFKNQDKTYTVEIELGATTETYDLTGNIKKTAGEIIEPTRERILEILEDFIGAQEQIPPMFSAKKIKGKKLYELARKGIEVERKPSEITIHDIKLLEYNYPNLKLEVKCGTGTYIRTLAHDIGQKLKTGAYCKELRRTEIGKYQVEDAQPPKKITSNNYQDFSFLIK